MALFANGMHVLVADGEKAMILVNDGTVDTPRLRLVDRIEQDLAAVREGIGDRPGRMPDAGPGQRSALDEGDPVRHAKARFAALVAARLERLPKGVRLVIAAPPQVLAALRDEMAPALRAHLVGEIDKSFTQMPLERMAPLLAREIDRF